MKQIDTYYAFNRGIIAQEALSRLDVKRTALSARTQTNFVSKLLGSMTIRPGMKHLGSTRNNLTAVNIPFIFSTTDLAIIELTDQSMRVLVNDTPVTRPSVSSAITNGTFTSDITGWTSADEAGSTSSWATGGYMSLVGTQYTSAIRYQLVTVSGADQNVLHAIRIIVHRGEVTFKVGSTLAGEEYIRTTLLGEGEHSLAFIPTGNFYVQVESLTKYASLLDSVTVESAGDMVLPTPWVEADLGIVRTQRLGNIVFCAAEGYRQQKIERRGINSWSVVDYWVTEAPFDVVNTSYIRLTPSALSGDITLTASRAKFRAEDVGENIKIDSTGQKVSSVITGAAQWSDPIRVTGVGATRDITVDITGTWAGTVRLQQSVGDIGSWVSVNSWTTNVATTYNDTLDNQIIYYRIGIDTAEYTSGSATVTLTYSTGSIRGIVRITAYSSPTSVSAIVLKELGGLTASENWTDSLWSEYKGYPSSVAYSDGRLWWLGIGSVFGSVSDDIYNFDASIEGDSAAIIKSLGEWQAESTNWALALNRLVIGTTGAEISVRSDQLDGVVTPANYNAKASSTVGSSSVTPVKVDTSGVFVGRGGKRIYELAYEFQTYSYTTNDLTQMVPDISNGGFTSIAIQRLPNTRITGVRADGTAAMLLFDKLEGVNAWVEIETDGLIENVCVLPGTEEDFVYFVVNRTINSSTVRYLEKFALESECKGDPVCKLADSFIEYSGAETTTITGLSSLEGETVVCWGWNTVTPFTDSNNGRVIGKDMGTFVVASGQITGLPNAVTDAVVGLGYTAQFESGKLTVASRGGTPLLQVKKITRIGFVLADTHKQGVKYGASFDRLDSMPLMDYEGSQIDTNGIWSEYDKETFSFPGEWDTNSRMCIQAAAPRPCTVTAAVINVEGHDNL